MLGNIPETSEREFLKSYLSSGYPLGTQSLLGTFSGLTGYLRRRCIYQGFISGLAALAAVALATLIASVCSGLARAALIAFVAMSANLTYQYALQGGIKEIGLLATLAATVGARPARRSRSAGHTPARRSSRSVLPRRWRPTTPWRCRSSARSSLFLGVACARYRANRDRASRWIGPVAAGGCLRRCWRSPR